MIPKHYKTQFCNSEKTLACDYYMDKSCPNTCGMARRLQQGITHHTKTGLQRFIGKYGDNYLGIGAVVNVPDEMKGEFLE